MMTSMKIPTISQIEKAIGRSTDKWIGNCKAIADDIVDAGLVKGHAVYGMWIGPIDPRSIFGRRPFTHHGWIVLPDKRVMDPTRWVFEATDPYVYVGSEEPVTACRICGYTDEEHNDFDDYYDGICSEFTAPVWPYDEGGNQIMKKFRPPPPGCNPHERKYHGAPPIALQLLKTNRKMITMEQMGWIANTPYDVLGSHVGDVYNWIINAGRSALIPIDNRRRAEREGLINAIR